MTYKTINRVGSPRLHLLNTLKANDIYSEFPKDGFTKVIDHAGYYFSEELIEKDFDFENCTHGKTSGDFMNVSGYSRPKINTYIEKHGRVFFFHEGYYDLKELKGFIKENISEFIEKRGRPAKS